LEEIGSSAQVHVTLNQDGEFERLVQGRTTGTRRKRASTRTRTRTARPSSNNSGETPKPGFNMDGSKRAKNLSLNDALAQLQWIKEAKARAAAQAGESTVGDDTQDAQIAEPAAGASDGAIDPSTAASVAENEVVSPSDTTTGESEKGVSSDANEHEAVDEEATLKARNASDAAECATPDASEAVESEVAPANGNSKRVSLRRKTKDAAVTSEAVAAASDNETNEGKRPARAKRAVKPKAEAVTKTAAIKKKDTGKKVIKATKSAAKSVVKTSGAAAAAPTGVESKGDEEDPFDGLTEAELSSLGWSNARVQAFMQRKENPNAYYYRFNAPGEVQSTGTYVRFAFAVVVCAIPPI
jgi:hypothetical protein